MQQMKILVAGDVSNGWAVTIDDGEHSDVWTPPALRIEDAVVTAIGDHVARYGHNVRIVPPPTSDEDKAMIERLTRERDAAVKMVAAAKAELAEATKPKEPYSAAHDTVEPAGA